MKDYRKYEDNLEPQDFTRIHDADLTKLRRTLTACLNVFDDPRFTDRHGMGEMVRKALSKD